MSVRVVVATLLVFFAVSTATADESNVVEIPFETFGKVTAEGDWLVEFYAPWCNACKAFAPQYEKIANKLKEEIPSLKVGKVDASKNEAFQKEFEIEGFPTLASIRNNGETVEKYKGDLRQKDIITFIEKLDSSAISVVDHGDSSALEKIIEKSTAVFISNCPEEGSSQHEIFDKVANKYHLSDPTVSWVASCGAHAETPAGERAIFALKDGSVFKCTHEKESDIDKWIKMLKRPWVEELTPQNFMEHATERPRVVVAVVDWENKNKESSDYLDMMAKVAQKFALDAGFTFMDGSFAPSKGLATSRGIPDGHYPSFFVWSINQNEWWLDLSKTEQHDIETWLQDVFDGKVDGQQPKKEDLVGNEETKEVRNAEDDPDYMGDGAAKEEL